jgi:hypothetical protein
VLAPRNGQGEKGIVKERWEQGKRDDELSFGIVATMMAECQSREDTPMFTSADIKERISKTPFVPIRIITSAGDRYEVSHPDLIMVGRRDITVGTSSKKDPAIYEQVSRISILHVASIEDMPVASSMSPEANGTS